MKEKKGGGELAQEILQRHLELLNQRSSWDSHWQNIASYVMPRKAQITSKSDTPSLTESVVLHDATAIRANMVLANGQLSWMTPMESRWFSYDAPAHLKGVDAVEQYYRACSEIAAMELARSTFYSEIHELYLDRGGFGTACIFVEEGRQYPLNFTKFDVGSFCIAENDEGYVDTISREFELDARQAKLKFGEENLPPKLRECLKDSKKQYQKHTFVHHICPRDSESREYGKADGRNKPVASIYVHKEERHVVRNSGFDEQPFFATRYLKWTNCSPYGWSPSWMALPDVKQLNFLEMQMDALAELAAFPRFLIPSDMEGEVDFRASGVTYFNPQNPSAIPREWGTSGRYDVGQARAETRRRAIEEAFHVDLFQMFSQLEKQMTAREVGERASEKLIQFSPTFARMTTELFNPMLRRVFAILLRRGHFPDPPPELVQDDGADQFLPEPELTYSSRIALAIKAMENASFARTLEIAMPLTQVKPEILDNYDLDTIIRDMSRNDGLPSRWLVQIDTMKEIRTQRAQGQAQAMQAQQMEQIAGAASKAGSVKEDSVLGQALKSQMPS